jgi:hypothetical protein
MEAGPPPLTGKISSHDIRCVGRTEGRFALSKRHLLF